MREAYSEALAKARKELAENKVKRENLDKYFLQQEKEMNEAKKQKERVIGECQRLERLCDSLLAAGGVE